MSWTRFAVAIAVVLLSMHPAAAQSGADLEKSKGCPACHQAAATRIGPSYAEIAAKYRGESAAVDKIVTMLKEGRRHPRAAASDAELRAIAAHVVSAR